jgi:hypothetical protein
VSPQPIWARNTDYLTTAGGCVESADGSSWWGWAQERIGSDSVSEEDTSNFLADAWPLLSCLFAISFPL